MSAVYAKKLFEFAWHGLLQPICRQINQVIVKEVDQLMSILNKAYKAAERQGRLDFLRITFLLHDPMEKK